MENHKNHKNHSSSYYHGESLEDELGFTMIEYDYHDYGYFSSQMSRHRSSTSLQKKEKSSKITIITKIIVRFLTEDELGFTMIEYDYQD